MRIELPSDAQQALGKIATREHRDPQNQAAHIVVGYLRRRGLIEPATEPTPTRRVETDRR